MTAPGAGWSSSSRTSAPSPTSSGSTSAGTGSACMSSTTGPPGWRPPAGCAGRLPPRHRAAGPGRHRDLPPPARGRRLDAGHLPHRPRRRGRPDRRAGAGRRRLRHEAVQPARAGGPGAGRAAARRRQPGRGRAAQGRRAGHARPGRRSVTVDGAPVQLTSTEFDLLAHLISRPGRVFTREELLAARLGVRRARRHPYGRRARGPGAGQARRAPAALIRTVPRRRVHRRCLRPT